jgi:hypothetical protein
MGKSKNTGNQAKIDGDVSDSIIVTGSGNTINTGGSNKGSPQNKHDVWQWVVISILGIALIGIVFANFDLPLSGTAGTKTQTLTLTLIPSHTPTDTVPLIESASTSEPPTNTPEPTSTLIPPVPLGEDWVQGCISKLWSPNPSTFQTEDKGNGCWKEPIHAFSAEKGDLDFLYERQNGDEEIYGLFAPLPIESGSLALTIRLRDLSNADLLIGIFSQPEVKSQGLLMMMLNGSVDSNVFIQKDPFTYETIIGSQKIFQGNGYSITFRFDNLSVRSIVNPSVFFIDPFSLPASQKYLFIGYKGLRGYYRIEGTFLNFELKE